MTTDARSSDHSFTGQLSQAAATISASFAGPLDAASNSEYNALQAVALQAMTLALSLAVHNAVAEQQQAQILRTALTTAAAKAILSGKRAQAEEILAMANSKLVMPDLTAVIAEVRAYLEHLKHQFPGNAISSPLES